MRINLTTPFGDKDAAKALGARWDSARKIWYVVNPQDLTPFMRWIPNLDAARDEAANGVSVPPIAPTSTKAATAGKASLVTGPTDVVAPCDCDVLPWADCAHTLG